MKCQHNVHSGYPASSSDEDRPRSSASENENGSVFKNKKKVPKKGNSKPRTASGGKRKSAARSDGENNSPQPTPAKKPRASDKTTSDKDNTDFSTSDILKAWTERNNKRDALEERKLKLEERRERRAYRESKKIRRREEKDKAYDRLLKMAAHDNEVVRKQGENELAKWLEEEAKGEKEDSSSDSE